MKPGLRFLIAAKRCEITELDQLARTSALVESVAGLIHELQRERGLSNLYLASCGRRWADERSSQIGRSDAAQARVLACFDDLDTEDGALRLGARLHARIAYALQGLDALVTLRQRIDAQATSAAQASADLARLISALLAVVFEAADSATEPLISRRLVALFNFMQGKEFAGQERATGSAMYAAGEPDIQGQQRLLHLIDSQERCLQTFGEFASPAMWARWLSAPQAEDLVRLERMRRIVSTTPPGQPLCGANSQDWFDACTSRIDTMRRIEEALVAELLGLCRERTACARLELEQLQAATPSAGPDADFFSRPTPTDLAASDKADSEHAYGHQLGRSMLDLVQDQARRLQAMEDELETVRSSLHERKLIERAKGLLMAHRQLSEEAAHKTMRQMAMSQNRRLVEVAEAVLAMADVLPSPR